MLNLENTHATINMNDPNYLNNFVESTKAFSFQRFVWRSIRDASFSEAVFDIINIGFYEGITEKVMVPLHRKMTSAVDLILHE